MKNKVKEVIIIILFIVLGMTILPLLWVIWFELIIWFGELIKLF